LSAVFDPATLHPVFRPKAFGDNAQCRVTSAIEQVFAVLETSFPVGEKSAAAFERARHLMPGGVNSPARAFGAVGGTPLFIEKAQGPYLYDIDGNRYIDYIGSWGPMILGHRPPAVIEAITKAIERGTSFGAPTEAESRLAEQIIEAVPSIEKVRLVNSGTEATMSAIRVARGATGRHKIIKFAGNYHGHVDSLLVAAGSAAATLGVPDSPGVTPGAGQDTIVLSYNDVDGVINAFARHPGEIAAVILEPVVGNMGCVPPTEDFLKTLRSETLSDGAILLFDEVMTGFRLAFGGAQERFGVVPDMTTLGKIVGGGLPLGAYGGRVDIMDNVLPAGKVFQAGTLSGNPVAVAAGSATLEQLKENPPYEQLDLMGDRLAAGMHKAATKHGIAHQVQHVGSMLTLFFNSKPVHNWPDANRSDRQAFGRYFWGLIEKGIYMPCSQFEALFFSSLHDEAIIDETVDAVDSVLSAI
jgi:glutamate-1-semialdehyde 2,1-aminomutase